MKAVDRPTGKTVTLTPCLDRSLVRGNRRRVWRLLARAAPSSQIGYAFSLRNYCSGNNKKGGSEAALSLSYQPLINISG